MQQTCQQRFTFKGFALRVRKDLVKQRKVKKKSGYTLHLKNICYANNDIINGAIGDVLTKECGYDQSKAWVLDE